ncbi:VWA domain-containing protein [Pseudomonas sp. PDM22]|uniref:VWA domain-containing protein n=1 Tax=Pseudomonas sp. PDM22 TaxID=2769287 RepID=UPI001780AA85|nr:VWA domain-containing protein [Pseudomonas sp. PDM22]MBD9517100.1 VWA domain-containing protein [Pseudomonas sp. PDM22]
MPFHRPLWLLLIVVALLLLQLWRRRQNLGQRLAERIAPHLLQHLLLDQPGTGRLSPAHLLTLFLCLGAVAVAGPVWPGHATDFADDRGLLILAVELSPSMDAPDLRPTRLEAAKRKLRDLLRDRQGAPTALIAYAGSAHLVLPPTDDPGLLESYVQALSTALIETPGSDLRGVQHLAASLSEEAGTPASLVLFADNADPRELNDLQRHASDALQWLLVDCSAAPSGRSASLTELASALDAGLRALSPDDSDVRWIGQQAVRHFQARQEAAQGSREVGYWLCWALLPVVLLSLRRGCRVHWLGAALLALGAALPSPPAMAASWLDAFASPDQQGRWALQHGRPALAAERFDDPYWKALATYQAADYAGALALFSRLDTAEAQFYAGNCQARQYRLTEAIKAYRRALALKADFPEARANLALVEALEKDREDAAQNAPKQRGDDEVIDDSADKGRSIAQPSGQRPADEHWLDSLQTSPAAFLRNKFRAQGSHIGEDRP